MAGARQERRSRGALRRQPRGGAGGRRVRLAGLSARWRGVLGPGPARPARRRPCERTQKLFSRRLKAGKMAERELTALKTAYGLKPTALSRLWRAPAEAGVVTYCVLPSLSRSP